MRAKVVNIVEAEAVTIENKDVISFAAPPRIEVATSKSVHLRTFVARMACEEIKVYTTKGLKTASGTINPDTGTLAVEGSPSRRLGRCRKTLAEDALSRGLASRLLLWCASFCPSDMRAAVVNIDEAEVVTIDVEDACSPAAGKGNRVDESGTM